MFWETLNHLSQIPSIQWDFTKQKLSIWISIYIYLPYNQSLILGKIKISIHICNSKFLVRWKRPFFFLRSQVVPLVQFSSVAQLCLTPCDPMNRSTPGLPVHHQFPESTQTHVHRVGDAIQSPHPLLSPSPLALNFSQNQGLFKWVSSWHEVAKVLEFQLQHQSFQWTPKTDRSPLGWTGWISCSQRDSQEFAPTPQFKSINSSVLSFLHSPTLTSIHDFKP